MVGQVLVLLALLLAPGARASVPAPPAQDSQAMTLAARRFFQPGGGATTVEVSAELALRSVAPAAGALARYRVEVSVRDSAGTVLTTDGWNREIPAAVARRSGASNTESFRFAAAPGRYTVRVRAAAADLHPVERELVVPAFAERPATSDLVLATAVRQVASDTEIVDPGEIRRGGLAMRTSPLPSMPLDSARIAYYMEVYPWPGAAADGQLRVEVMRGPRRMVATPPRQIRIEPPGGVARGSLDLTGLPEGRYVMRVLVQFGDSAVSVEAPFAVVAPRPAAAPVAVAGPFDAMSEAALDSLFGPVEFILDDRERGTYGALSEAGKRRFLEEVWRRRDPTPRTPDNPALAEFMRMVAYVNAAFREPGSAATAGWATDRGRVYLRNGAPEEVLRRPTASPRPYEAWKYTRGRMRYYVFFDRTGLGNYDLIGTNDVRETSQADWQGFLGRQNAQDVTDFIR